MGGSTLHPPPSKVLTFPKLLHMCTKKLVLLARGKAKNSFLGDRGKCLNFVSEADSGKYCKTLTEGTPGFRGEKN